MRLHQYVVLVLCILLVRCATFVQNTHNHLTLPEDSLAVPSELLQEESGFTQGVAHVESRLESGEKYSAVVDLQVETGCMNASFYSLLGTILVQIHSCKDSTDILYPTNTSQLRVESSDTIGKFTLLGSYPFTFSDLRRILMGKVLFPEWLHSKPVVTLRRSSSECIWTTTEGVRISLLKKGSKIQAVYLHSQRDGWSLEYSKWSNTYFKKIRFKADDTSYFVLFFEKTMR